VGSQWRLLLLLMIDTELIYKISQFILHPRDIIEGRSESEKSAPKSLRTRFSGLNKVETEQSRPCRRIPRR